MKMQKLLQIISMEESFHEPTLCKTWPELAFQRTNRNKKENFRVFYDKKNNCVKFNGKLSNPVELHYLRDFLQDICVETKVKREDISSWNGRKCSCGADDWEYLGKGDWFPAPLSGGVELMFKCKSCERYTTLQTVIR